MKVLQVARGFLEIFGDFPVTGTLEISEIQK